MHFRITWSTWWDCLKRRSGVEAWWQRTSLACESPQVWLAVPPDKEGLLVMWNALFGCPISWKNGKHITIHKHITKNHLSWTSNRTINGPSWAVYTHFFLQQSPQTAGGSTPIETPSSIPDCFDHCVHLRLTRGLSRFVFCQYWFSLFNMFKFSFPWTLEDFKDLAK